MAPWDAAGAGGGMPGGVERGCVFTSAGESGIVAVLSFLSTAGGRGEERKRGTVKQAEGMRGTHAGCGPALRAPGGGPRLCAQLVPIPGPSVPPTSLSCAPRRLTSLPPGLRGQAWGSPFQVGWRAELGESWVSGNGTGVLPGAWLWGGLGLLPSRPGAGGHPPGSGLQTLTLSASSGGRVQRCQPPHPVFDAAGLGKAQESAFLTRSQVGGCRWLDTPPGETMVPRALTALRCQKACPGWVGSSQEGLGGRPSGVANPYLTTCSPG